MKESIELLEPLIAVRKRPGMYLGPLDAPDLANELLREALCCARDDAFQGRCTSVEIELERAGRAIVRDDGPGLPLEADANGLRKAEAYLSVLFACSAGKSDPAIAESTCAFGLAVLNAVSSTFRARVYAGGEIWEQEYAFGRALSPFAVVGASDRHGTELAFTLDPSIVAFPEFDLTRLEQWIAAEVRHLRVRVVDRRVSRVIELVT